MSEWWTYRLSDFLLFSPKAYYRLLELYNREVWPLHLVAILAGIVILIASLRRGRMREGRLIAAMLAAMWLWVGYAFHLKRYSGINFAATWFATAFGIEALLIIWTGMVRGRLETSPLLHSTQRFGLGLFAFALFFEPLLGALVGRSWVQMELFGMTPDPTVVGTLGIVLFLGEHVRASLLIVPLLWCAISGATLWAMRAPDALLLPLAGALAVVLALWRGQSSNPRSTR